jgi:hypothetical protein
VNLVKGWNLIGNGYNQSFNAASLLNSSTIVSVWKWIASSSSWAFYAPSLSSTQLSSYTQQQGYQVLSTINAGDGFWVNASTAQSLSLPGGAGVSSSSFAKAGANPLSKGWSLIAIGDSSAPSAFNGVISNASNTNLTSLWAWDANQTKWFFFSPSLNTAGTLNSYISLQGYESFGTSVLSPTTGFWVNSP